MILFPIDCNKLFHKTFATKNKYNNICIINNKNNKKIILCSFIFFYLHYALVFDLCENNQQKNTIDH